MAQRSTLAALAFDPISQTDGGPGTLSSRHFHRCMLALERAGAVSVPLPFVLAGCASIPKGNEPGVLISFDAARSSVLTVASDILVQSNHSAVVFVATDEIGAPGNLSQQQLRVLLGMGVAVGSRGQTGEDLTTMRLPALRRQLGVSRQVLSSLVGYDVRLLALPEGRSDQRVIDEAYRAGYTTLFGSRPSLSSQPTAVHGRFSIDSGVRPSALEALVLGHRRAVLSAYLRGAVRYTASSVVGNGGIARLRSLLLGG